MHTAVMTDTNSGISLEDGRALGIFVLPMPVIVDGQDYLEEVSITHEDLYKAIRKGSDVSSSQPSPGSLTEMWDRILSNGYDELVYIPMSSGLSSSCASALALAADYDGRVEVADNHRISVSLHDSVMDALSLAREGRTAREIREYLEETGAMSSIYITVNTLALLKKSGRVTPAAAAIATVMHLKPVLTIQGGKLDTFSKARGIRHSERKMLDAVADDIRLRFSDHPSERISIGAASTFEDPEEEKAWLQAVRTAFPGHPTFYGRLACSIACHVSVNAIGIGVSVLHEAPKDGIIGGVTLS